MQFIVSLKSRERSEARESKSSATVNDNAPKKSVSMGQIQPQAAKETPRAVSKESSKVVSKDVNGNAGERFNLLIMLNRVSS